MNTQTRIRQLLIVITLVLTLAALVLLLWGAQLVLELWQQLLALPWPLLLVFVALLIAVACAGLLITLWLWRSRPHESTRASRPTRRELDADTMQQHLQAAQRQGVDTAAAEREFGQALDPAGALRLALFGEVSSGKSSLIRALLPEAEVSVDVLAGSTRQIERHLWQHQGHEVELIDLPGSEHDINEQGLLDEARRADLVLLVCDNDLTASQWRHLQTLKGLDKPLLVVLNKADRLDECQREQIEAALHRRLQTHKVALAVVAAGRRERVLIEGPDGKRQNQLRPAEPDISDLLAALREQLNDVDRLQNKRQQARFALSLEQLERSRLHSRHQQGEVLVKRYSRRAMVGALAAMAPGSDLIIQGALAWHLMRQLGELYQVEVRDMDIEHFLSQTKGRFRAATSLSLAVAGNALKSFPGMGTLTGGLTHAVAYGLIFDSVGRAANDALARHGRLVFDPEMVEQHVSQDIEQRAQALAAVALAGDSQRDRQQQG